MDTDWVESRDTLAVNRAFSPSNRAIFVLVEPGLMVKIFITVPSAS